MPVHLMIDRLALTLLGVAAVIAAPPAAAQSSTTHPPVAIVAPTPTPLRVSAFSLPGTPVTRARPIPGRSGEDRRASNSVQPAAPVAGTIDRPRLATGSYYALLGGAVAANAVGQFIDDPGGYPKQWDQWTVFHLIGGWSLDALGEKLAVPVTYKRIPVRPLAVCTAIVAWEHAKGFADWRDMAAGCTGAAVSAGSTWLFRALF